MATDTAQEEVIGTLTTLLTANYTSYLAALQTTSIALTKWAKDAEEVIGDGAAKSFKGLGEAALIAAGVALFSWYKVSALIYDVTLQTQRLQSSAEFIHQWNAASILAGKSTETFANSLEGLHERIQDLAMQPIQNLNQLFSGGNRPFTLLGLSPLQLQGMGAEQQLNILADALSKIQNQAAQLNIAKELGLEYMLPYLKNGSAGIAELHKQLESLNLELTEKQTASVTSAVTAWRMLRLALMGAETQISAAVAPTISFLANTLSLLTTTVSNLAVSFPTVTSFLSGFGVVLLAVGIAVPILTFGVGLLVDALASLDAVLWVLTAGANPILMVIELLVVGILYATGALGKLRDMVGGTFKGTSINANIHNQYVGGGDPTMMAILANNKEQLNTQQQMVAALKKSAPPHMAYNW